MVVLINAGNSQVTYRAAITLEAACVQNCANHYVGTLSGCPAQHCADCGIPGKGDCSCIGKTSTSCNQAQCIACYTTNLPGILGDGTGNWLNHCGFSF